MSQAIEIGSWIFLVSGSIFCVIGGIGIIRMPDFFTRTHAASITVTMGAGLVLAGLFLQGVGMMFDENMAWVPDAWLVPVKILFLGLFILLTSPTSGHALVKAAYAHGLCAKVSEGFSGELVTDTLDHAADVDASNVTHEASSAAADADADEGEGDDDAVSE